MLPGSSPSPRHSARLGQQLLRHRVLVAVDVVTLALEVRLGVQYHLRDIENKRSEDTLPYSLIPCNFFFYYSH